MFKLNAAYCSSGTTSVGLTLAALLSSDSANAFPKPSAAPVIKATLLLIFMLLKLQRSRETIYQTLLYNFIKRHCE